MWFWILMAMGASNLCLGNGVIGGLLIAMAFGSKTFSDGTDREEE